MNGQIFPFQEPTPEQRAEAEKQRLRMQASLEARIREALPLLKQARQALHQIEALGVTHDRIMKARQHLAVIEDRFEIELVRPAELPR